MSLYILNTDCLIMQKHCFLKTYCLHRTTEKRLMKQERIEIEDTNCAIARKSLCLAPNDRYSLKNLHVYKSQRSRWCKPESADTYDPQTVFEPENFHHSQWKFPALSKSKVNCICNVEAHQCVLGMDAVDMHYAL